MAPVGFSEIRAIGNALGVERFGTLKQLYRSIARASGEEGKRGLQEILAFAKGQSQNATAKFVVDNKEYLELYEKFYQTSIPEELKALYKGGTDIRKVLTEYISTVKGLFPKFYSEGSKTNLAVKLQRYGKSSGTAEVAAKTVANGEKLGQARVKFLANDAGKRVIASGETSEFGNYRFELSPSHVPLGQVAKNPSEAFSMTSDGANTILSLKPFQIGNLKAEGTACIQTQKGQELYEAIDKVTDGNMHLIKDALGA